MSTELQQAFLKVGHVKALLNVLQAIRSTKYQACTINWDLDGVRVRWTEDSKSLQSAVQLRPELFAEYSCPEEGERFGVQFTTLLDTLTVFASVTGAQLTMRYPGLNGDLIFEMTEETAAGSSLTTYARLDTMDTEIPSELQDYWQDPSSYFLIPGEMLKEMVEDLEWTDSPVTLALHRDPARLTLSSQGTGVLEIEVPVGNLAAFHCSQPEVRYRYSHKHLRTACANIAFHRDSSHVSSKVTIDANGLMKVTHMISMPGAGEHGVDHTQRQGPHAFLSSQRTGSGGPVGIVLFTMVALEDI